MTLTFIGVGVQSTLGGHDIFARKKCMKTQQNTRFFIIFARKINKILEFYTISARKVPEFYIIIARRIFFPDFFFWGGGGGHVPPSLPHLLRLC